MAKFAVDTFRHKSYKDVIRSFEKIKPLLKPSGLETLIVFNDAYLVVTQNIKKSADLGKFHNQKFIEKFTVCFSGYYFDAINKYFTNSKSLPVAWSELMTSMPKNTPQFIRLMAGANAHINHDLPLALHELLQKENSPDNLLEDLRQLDKVLMTSGYEITANLRENNPKLDFLRRNFKFTYYRPAMYTILYWRIRAFASYRRIKKYGTHKSGYEKYSVVLSRRLRRISIFILALV